MLHPKEWVTNYGDYLYSIALLKTNNKEVAEDLVQDTFLSAIKASQNFRGDSSEKTWLTSILKNKIIDFYRKKDVLKNYDSYVDETESSFDAAFFQTDNLSSAHWKKDAIPASWSENADLKINENEFYSVVKLCVEKLPTKLLPIFTAKFIDDEDSEKICKDYNISSSNYWVIIHRAKLLMRSCLEKNWFINLK